MTRAPLSSGAPIKRKMSSLSFIWQTSVRPPSASAFVFPCPRQLLGEGEHAGGGRRTATSPPSPRRRRSLPLSSYDNNLIVASDRSRERARELTGAVAGGGGPTLSQPAAAALGGRAHYSRFLSLTRESCPTFAAGTRARGRRRRRGEASDVKVAVVIRRAGVQREGAERRPLLAGIPGTRMGPDSDDGGR